MDGAVVAAPTAAAVVLQLLTVWFELLELLILSATTRINVFL